MLYLAVLFHLLYRHQQVLSYYKQLFVMPVVLPSINKKSFHWSACLYASRLFLGTISLHLDLLMSVKTPDSQVGGTTASLEICVILVQLSNAYSPIALTLSPICTFCRLVHPLKASLPIVVTLLGMVTEVRELQSLCLLLVDYQCYTL